METEMLSVSTSPVSSLHIRKQHNDNDRCLGFGPALFELSLSLSSGDGPEASGEMINILKLFLQLHFILGTLSASQQYFYLAICNGQHQSVCNCQQT